MYRYIAIGISIDMDIDTGISLDTNRENVKLKPQAYIQTISVVLA